MPLEDMQMTRRVQREIGKRVALDSTQVNTRAVHGVVYITGRVRAMRGAVNLSLEDEMQIVAQNIKRIPGVRDVVIEVSYG
jgi:acid phosphatase class B